MRIAVFGLGYVGCVSAACLARDGHHVIGVDVNAEKVSMINNGASPIVEPGLAELMARVVRDGRLSATTSADEAVGSTDIALICVGTPDIGHGQPDLEALARVADAVGLALSTRADLEAGPYVVVLRSTVPPGTVEQLRTRVTARIGASVHVGMNPEFMREGSSLEDFDHPPFIIAGCEDDETEAALRELYAPVEAPFIRTSIRTAEMIKYACNAYHALKVCFTNEIADLCEALGADARDVMRVFRLDTKLNVSEAYLKPGFAFGGSCLPKDVRALLCASRINDVPVPLLSAIPPSNEGQIRRAIEAVLATRKKRIGVVGLAFKSTTDDLRESPIVTLVETLIGKGCDIRIFDPNVVMARLKGANRRYIEGEIPHIASLLCDDVDALLDHAEVLVFGSAGREADRIAEGVRPEHIVIDLTRGGIEPKLKLRPTTAAGRATAATVPRATEVGETCVAR